MLIETPITIDREALKGYSCACEARLLLNKYRVFQSQDIERLDQLLREYAAGKVRTAKLIPGGHGFTCNAFTTSPLPIFALSSDFNSTFDFEPVEYIRFVFQTRGEATVTAGGREFEVNSRNSSYILPADVAVSERQPEGYQSLAIRIEPSELKRRLSALCEVDSPDQVLFDQPDETDPRFVDFVRKPLFAAARELDSSDKRFHRNLLDDVKAVTLTRLLLFAPHNFAKLFNARAASPGRSQMSRAEDYIAANWDKAVDVIGLAEAVGVSARTILRHFREKHGETPRDYIRRIRLDRARTMLLTGDKETTVIGVALKCSFNSLGHFAESYRRRFGELPSETLRKKD